MSRHRSTRALTSALPLAVAVLISAGASGCATAPRLQDPAGTPVPMPPPAQQTADDFRRAGAPDAARQAQGRADKERRPSDMPDAFDYLEFMVAVILALLAQRR